MEIIDITAPFSPEMLSWPGQEPPSHEFLAHQRQGDPNTVSWWQTGGHTGTHVDAPLHFIPNGAGIEALDLRRSIGPCRVLDLSHVEGHVGRNDLEAAGISGEQRLLFKTRNSGEDLMRRGEFEEGYVAVSREAAEYLIEAGVETLGVDYLSVEPFEDAEFGEGEFRTHHALLQAGVTLLEGLVLTEVEPGEYFLACLPLKLVGSDGSPARAVLIRGLNI